MVKKRPLLEVQIEKSFPKFFCPKNDLSSKNLKISKNLEMESKVLYELTIWSYDQFYLFPKNEI